VEAAELAERVMHAGSIDRTRTRRWREAIHEERIMFAYAVDAIDWRGEAASSIARRALKWKTTTSRRNVATAREREEDAAPVCGTPNVRTS
jgi:hypothetical protein